MTSMVYCAWRTEHPCPQPNYVHGLLRLEKAWLLDRAEGLGGVQTGSCARAGARASRVLDPANDTDWLKL